MIEGRVRAPPCLVFPVLNFFDIFTPACSTAHALAALIRGRAYVSSSRLSHDRGPMSPGVAGQAIILCIA